MTNKRWRLFACGLWYASMCSGLFFAMRGEARPYCSADEAECVAVEAADEQPYRSVDSCATESLEGARLQLEHAFHDFGEIQRKGGNLVYDFPFVNNGRVPLVITRVVTSCSCIKASFPRRPVAPGGRECIRITYEPLKSEPGTFHKVIQIFSNAVGGMQVVTVQGCAVDERDN